MRLMVQEILNCPHDGSLDVHATKDDVCLSVCKTVADDLSLNEINFHSSSRMMEGLLSHDKDKFLLNLLSYAVSVADMVLLDHLLWQDKVNPLLPVLPLAQPVSRAANMGNLVVLQKLLESANMHGSITSQTPSTMNYMLCGAAFGENCQWDSVEMLLQYGFRPQISFAALAYREAYDLFNIALQCRCDGSNLRAVRLVLKYRDNNNQDLIWGRPHLVSAIRFGAPKEIFEAVLEAVSQWTDPGDYPQGTGRSILDGLPHHAIRSNKFDMLQMLLSMGVDPGGPYDDENPGATPAHIAAKLASLDMLILLHTYGVDMDSPDDSGATPLHYAVLGGRLGDDASDREVEIVKFLITVGVNVNPGDPSVPSDPFISPQRAFPSPLFLAAGNRMANVVKLLLSHGAKVDFQIYGQTPLLYCLAAPFPCYDTIEALVKAGANVNTAVANNQSPCREACRPLFCASNQSGPANIVNPIDRYRLLNESEDNEKTPLELAILNCRRQSLPISKLLLDAGADINAPTSNKSTFLHLFSMSSLNSRLVPLLIEKGADLNATDSFGRTPLFVCITRRNKCRGVALCLIQAGADVSIAGRLSEHASSNITPLEKAIVVEANSEIVNELLVRTPGFELIILHSLRAAAHTAITDANVQSEDLPLAAHSESSHSLTENLTGSCDAILLGSYTIIDHEHPDSTIRLLVEHGKINAQDEHGDTALHLLALQAGGLAWPTMRWMVQEGGADLTILNRRGAGALEVLVRAMVSFGDRDSKEEANEFVDDYFR